MSPRRIQRGMALRAATVLAAVICLVPGCARWRRGESRVTSRTASPSVRAAEQGLSLWTWVVSDSRRQLPATGERPAPFLIRDDKTDIESLLARYMDRPVPLPDEVRRRWQGAGLRIVAVPAQDLDRLVSSSRLVGQVQSQWLGEVLEWSDIVRGVSITEPTRVALADGVIELAPGRLRLALRAWIVPDAIPDAPATAALHMELAARLDPNVPERERFVAAAQGRPAPSPVVFSSLAAAMTHRGTDALVILADAPDADWASPPAPSAEDGPYGPQVPRAPSLGELVLSVPATNQTPRNRMVVAIVPRVPERFELLR